MPPTPAEDLKATVADAALHGAELRIFDVLRATHEVECIQSDKLVRQFRIRPKDPAQGGPRYFLVKVSEPL